MSCLQTHSVSRWHTHDLHVDVELLIIFSCFSKNYFDSIILKKERCTRILRRFKFFVTEKNYSPIFNFSYKYKFSSKRTPSLCTFILSRSKICYTFDIYAKLFSSSPIPQNQNPRFTEIRPYS